MLGVALLGLGGTAGVFALLARAWDAPAAGFALTAVTAGLVGTPLFAAGRTHADPTRREALLAVLSAWILIPLVGGLPYAIDGGMSPLDALFESMSGFTTTGATVLMDFDAFGPSLFLWRALSQWIGGIGIIVLFIAVFPQLAIAGRQLFFAEAPGPTEDRLTPRLRNTAGAVLIVYLGLTFLCGAAYRTAGMGTYDAVAHALTTLAAGGFSPEGRSFEAFSPDVQWVAIVFMAFAGANFALQFRALVGRPTFLLRDAEFRAYAAIVAVAAAGLSVLLASTFEGGDVIRHALFQTLSILTTTGFASTDFALWDEPAQLVLVLLMFVGGSAGSAAGGIKVVRLLIVAKNTVREVRRSLHPRAVLPVRVGHRTVPEDVLRAVAAFMTLYVGLFAATTVALVLMGSDFVTAFSAAIACLGNTGPGLAAVGPMSSFGPLPAAAKAVLVFAMYAGRLEVVTVFVVFTAGWWRLPRRWQAWRP